ncbi:MAG TPA: biopolymer transporter ExbD [Candidatus Eisenbacteria bacterium]|nr:biopolymer transporter ExbD [Candidatus Eisenbacteria bacterium]
MGAVDTPERRQSGKKKGHGRRKKRRIGIRIDMTPMVDIAFLLLIFFMVTTVFRTPQALEINLPPKDTHVDVKESMTLSIRILADDRMYWKHPPGTWTRSSVGQLHEVLAQFAGQKDLIVVVKIDRDAKFDHMVGVLDELHDAKLSRFSVNPMEDKEKQEVDKL